MSTPPIELADIPRVTGRHQNHVLAAARRTRAIQLKTQGWTYQQIADELGYANRGTVNKIVRTAQAAHLVEAAEVYRIYELDRLDALQVPLWIRAMEGDLRAIDTCRKIIESRCRLLGLYEPKGEKKGVCDQPQTVVLLEDDCRLRGCPDHT